MFHLQAEWPLSWRPACNMLGNPGHSIAIIGKKLGIAELARVDVVIGPKVLDIGPVDFAQHASAILKAERLPWPPCPRFANDSVAGRARKDCAGGPGESARGG